MGQTGEVKGDRRSYRARSSRSGQTHSPRFLFIPLVALVHDFTFRHSDLFI